MHHPTDTIAGPSDLALPLALMAFLAEREPAGTTGDGQPRAAELRTTGSRGRRAARRRATAVRG